MLQQQSNSDLQYLTAKQILDRLQFNATSEFSVDGVILKLEELRGIGAQLSLDGHETYKAISQILAKLPKSAISSEQVISLSDASYKTAYECCNDEKLKDYYGNRIIEVLGKEVIHRQSKAAKEMDKSIVVALAEIALVMSSARFEEFLGHLSFPEISKEEKISILKFIYSEKKCEGMLDSMFTFDESLEDISGQEICKIAEDFSVDSAEKALKFCKSVSDEYLKYEHSREKGKFDSTSIERFLNIWKDNLQKIISSENQAQTKRELIRDSNDYSKMQSLTSAIRSRDRLVSDFIRVASEIKPELCGQFLATNILSGQALLVDERNSGAKSQITIERDNLEELPLSVQSKLFIAQAKKVSMGHTPLEVFTNERRDFFNCLIEAHRKEPGIMNAALINQILPFAKSLAFIGDISLLTGKSGFEVAKLAAPEILPLLVALKESSAFSVHSKGSIQDINLRELQVPLEHGITNEQLFNFDQIKKLIAKQRLEDPKTAWPGEITSRYIQGALKLLEGDTKLTHKHAAQFIEFAQNEKFGVCDIIRHLGNKLAEGDPKMGRLQYALRSIIKYDPTGFLCHYQEFASLLGENNKLAQSYAEFAVTRASPRTALSFIENSGLINAKTTARLLPHILATANVYLFHAKEPYYASTAEDLIYGAIPLIDKLNTKQALDVCARLEQYSKSYAKKFPNKKPSKETDCFEAALVQLKQEIAEGKLINDVPKSRLLRYPKVNPHCGGLFMDSPTRHTEAEGWLSAHFHEAFVSGESLTSYVSKFSDLIKKHPDYSEYSSYAETLNKAVYGSACAWNTNFDFVGADAKFTESFVKDWLLPKVTKYYAGLWMHPQLRAYLQTNLT